MYTYSTTLKIFRHHRKAGEKNDNMKGCTTPGGMGFRITITCEIFNYCLCQTLPRRSGWCGACPCFQPLKSWNYKRAFSTPDFSASLYNSELFKDSPENRLH